MPSCGEDRTNPQGLVRGASHTLRFRTRTASRQLSDPAIRGYAAPVQYWTRCCIAVRITAWLTLSYKAGSLRYLIT